MNTNEVVDALSKDDHLGAETSFKTIMQQKVGDALEVKRKEVANNFVKTKVEDNAEEF